MNDYLEVTLRTDALAPGSEPEARVRGRWRALPQVFRSRARLALLGLSFASLAARAQAPLTLEQLRRWQHLDLQTDGMPGISANRACRGLLAGRTATPMLVAVIDSGRTSRA